MDMLILRPRSRHGDGKIKSRTAIWRKRERKFGKVSKEEYLSRTKDLAIYGPHSAGKSRWLTRMHEAAPQLWIGHPALLLRAVEPLGVWVDVDPRLAVWHDARPEVTAEQLRPWAKLRQPEKLAALLAWVEAEGVTLLLDDAHKLTARKADAALQLIRAAKVVIHTAEDEARLPISLRLALASRAPQVVRLSSDAAYDYTSAFIWVLCLLCAAAGAWPVAAAVGGLKVMAHGRKAARQS